VPGIFPAASEEDIIMAFWVGIDGWGNQQVLQAGTAVTVHPNATVEWWAWGEWWTEEFKDPPVKVENLPISPGDTVSVLVCAPTPQHGFVTVHNLTTGQARSMVLPGRDGISLEGATAEWAVEGISSALPVFLPSVTFTNCIAGTKSTTFDLRPSGFTTEIISDKTGKPMTKSTIVSDDIAVVEWKGFT
jgi:hypothetical protein